MIEDLRRRHLRLLRNAFDFARADESSWQRGASEAHALEVKTVREMVRKRVPCGTALHDVLDTFLQAPWPSRGDFDALWQLYADAGYVDPKGFVHILWRGEPMKASALEAAVFLKNPRVVRSLLSMGADVRAAPTQQWKASKRSKKAAAKDIHDFLKLAVKDDASRAELEALLVEAEMARRIDLAGDAAAVASRSPAAGPAGRPAPAPPVPPIIPVRARRAGI